MKVQIEQLGKQFGSYVAVEDLSLQINDGEFVALLGPSGCGKTTTLLMLAGIYKPDRGRMLFDDRVVNTLPPRERNIGMVFQSYALYPHMTVYENLTYPLRLQGVPKAEMRQRAERIAERMGIGQFLERRPGQLSGGQQQRVALGRALIKEPQLLLFDEPLSNLDARLRMSMRAEIKRLQLDLGITSVFVTHDQLEALTMADRIAVMSQGRLQAFATPEELYERPRTLFVANFIGNPPINMLEADLRAGVDGLEAASAALRVPIPPQRAGLLDGAAAASRRVLLGLRPEAVMLDEQGPVAGEVYIVEPLGRDDLVEVSVGADRLRLLAPGNSRLRIGDQVRFSVDGSKIQLFDPDTQASLLWN